MCKGNPNVTEADVVQIFSMLAFEDDTPARFWYEANQDRLLQKPSDGKTTYEHLLAAVKKQFAHIAPDPDQLLADMRLTPGMDLSTFVHKFVRIHKASTITEEKAAAYCEVHQRNRPVPKPVQCLHEQP